MNEWIKLRWSVESASLPDMATHDCSDYMAHDTMFRAGIRVQIKIADKSLSLSEFYTGNNLYRIWDLWGYIFFLYRASNYCWYLTPCFSFVSPIRKTACWCCLALWQRVCTAPQCRSWWSCSEKCQMHSSTTKYGKLWPICWQLTLRGIVLLYREYADHRILVTGHHAPGVWT